MKTPAPIKTLLEDWKPKLICLALAFLVWVVVKREVNLSHEIYRFFRTQEMLVPNQASQAPPPPSLATPASQDTPPAPAHASLPSPQ
jgi:hypothetical protein